MRHTGTVKWYNSTKGYGFIAREDNEKDVVMVSSKRVSCNGGGGALGHPLVYMDMGDEDYVICKYCDKVFKLGRHISQSCSLL